MCSRFFGLAFSKGGDTRAVDGMHELCVALIVVGTPRVGCPQKATSIVFLSQYACLLWIMDSGRRCGQGGRRKKYTCRKKADKEPKDRFSQSRRRMVQRCCWKHYLILQISLNFKNTLTNLHYIFFQCFSFHKHVSCEFDRLSGWYYRTRQMLRISYFWPDWNSYI